MKKTYWIYGGMMGVLLLVLQAVHYKAMIRDVQLEIFGGVIAVLFLGLGVWVGAQLIRRKKSDQINKQKARALQLSERELEVLALLDQGLSNQEISDRLFVSLNTTKTHISRIYQKMGVSRRTQAVQKARELDIISSPERTIS